MTTPSTESPLKQSELQTLDNFLRNRTHANSNLGLTYAHGFLCAVLTAPGLPHANYYSLFTSKNAVSIDTQSIDEKNVSFWLARLTDQISHDLQHDMLSPLLFDDGIISYREASWELLKKWCVGYLSGTNLDSFWMEDDQGITLTMPMGILADECDLTGQLDSEGRLITNNMPHKILAREHLLTTIASLYNYWGAQRTAYQGLSGGLH